MPVILMATIVPTIALYLALMVHELVHVGGCIPIPDLAAAGAAALVEAPPPQAVVGPSLTVSVVSFFFLIVPFAALSYVSFTSRTVTSILGLIID
jgi:hypothetical protein